MLDSLDISVSPDLRSVRRFLKSRRGRCDRGCRSRCLQQADPPSSHPGAARHSQQLKIPQRLVNARAKLNRATRRFPAARYALGVLYHLPARYLNPTQLKAGVKYRRQSGQRRTRPAHSLCRLEAFGTSAPAKKLRPTAPFRFRACRPRPSAHPSDRRSDRAPCVDSVREGIAGDSAEGRRAIRQAIRVSSAARGRQIFAAASATPAPLERP